MTKERVAVIGGSGFLGQFLIRDLIAVGVDPLNLDCARPRNNTAPFHAVDIRDESALSTALAGVGTIINLAAVHRDDVRPLSLYHDVNVTGSRNICTAADRHGIKRILFTSSVAVYGMNNGIADETTPPHPFNAYGETKLAAEQVYTAWQGADADRSLAIIRPTVIFGPGNRGNVHTLMDQIGRGRFIMIGSGENCKSMAYVENVSAYLVHRLRHLNAGITLTNYVDTPDYSMNDLVGTIADLMGRPVPSLRLPYGVGLAAGYVFDGLSRMTGKSLPISKIRIEKFCANTVFRADRARADGFTPPYDLTQALANTIAYEQTAAMPETHAA